MIELVCGPYVAAGVCPGSGGSLDGEQQTEDGRSSWLQELSSTPEGRYGLLSDLLYPTWCKLQTTISLYVCIKANVPYRPQ